MSDSIYLHQSLSLSPSSQSVPSSSSQLLLFTAIPQHIIVSPFHCMGYTALLKTLHTHFWWYVLPCCYDPHRLNNTFLFLGLWTYLNPWRFTIFSTVGVGGVKNLHTCVLVFYVMSVVLSHLVHDPYYGF